MKWTLSWIFCLFLETIFLKRLHTNTYPPHPHSAHLHPHLHTHMNPATHVIPLPPQSHICPPPPPPHTHTQTYTSKHTHTYPPPPRPHIHSSKHTQTSPAHPPTPATYTYAHLSPPPPPPPTHTHTSVFAMRKLCWLVWNFNNNKKLALRNLRHSPMLTRPSGDAPCEKRAKRYRFGFLYLPVTEDRSTGDVRVELWPVPVTHREPHAELEHLQSSFILTAASHQSCRGCSCGTCYTCKQFTCYTVYLLHMYSLPVMRTIYLLRVHIPVTHTVYLLRIQFTWYAYKSFTCYMYSLLVQCTS